MVRANGKKIVIETSNIITMKREVLGIDEKYKGFYVRLLKLAGIHLFLLVVISIILMGKFGLHLGVLLVISFLLLLWVAYGVRKSANILYKIYVDEERNVVEIQMLHFNTIKKKEFSAERVEVKVLQDATSRYIIDMIRIDVDKKTYFIQKQAGPWTRVKIDQAKSFPKSR